MKLDEGTLWLIAVGASVSANCLPCLEHNVKQALACGGRRGRRCHEGRQDGPEWRGGQDRRTHRQPRSGCAHLRAGSCGGGLLRCVNQSPQY